MDPDERIAVAAELLVQSPPGEINDVLNGLSDLPALFGKLTSRAATDIRTIIDDDVRLQKGIAGALEQYNLDQFVTVGAPDEDHQVRSTPLLAFSSPTNRTPGHRQRVWSRWKPRGEQVHRPPLKEIVCF